MVLYYLGLDAELNYLSNGIKFDIGHRRKNKISDEIFIFPYIEGKLARYSNISCPDSLYNLCWFSRLLG